MDEKVTRGLHDEPDVCVDLGGKKTKTKKEEEREKEEEEKEKEEEEEEADKIWAQPKKKK